MWLAGRLGACMAGREPCWRASWRRVLVECGRSQGGAHSKAPLATAWVSGTCSSARSCVPRSEVARRATCLVRIRRSEQGWPDDKRAFTQRMRSWHACKALWARKQPQDRTCLLALLGPFQQDPPQEETLVASSIVGLVCRPSGLSARAVLMVCDLTATTRRPGADSSPPSSLTVLG